MTPTELRAAMSALPEPLTDKQPPHWENWRYELWRHLARGENPAEFWKWPCVYHTMLQNHIPGVVEYEKNEMLTISGNFPGNPYDPNLSLYHNNIRQMYHLWKFEQVTGKNIAEMETIVEIGGGYGAACLVARRLGFKGKYIIYDLPEFSLLQRWYLSQAGVEGVEFITELPDVSFFKRKYADLLIGLYSLSEMPIQLRNNIFDAFPAFDFLLLYSQDWENYDNREYFQERISFEGVLWKHEEIEHLPDRGNWYSFGWQK